MLVFTNLSSRRSLRFFKPLSNSRANSLQTIQIVSFSTQNDEISFDFMLQNSKDIPPEQVLNRSRESNHSKFSDSRNSFNERRENRFGNKFDDEKPLRRRFDDNKPFNRFDGERSFGNRFDGNKSFGNRFDDNKPFRRFDGERSFGNRENRSFNRPPRNNYDEELINPFKLDEEKQGGGSLDFSKYEVPIQCEGKDIPPPIETLEDLELHPQILSNIRKMGINSLFPIQKNGLSILKNKRDLIACAQTGSGKTLAFLLPGINELLKNPRTDNPSFAPRMVIICPTRELAQQTANESLKLTHRTHLKTVACFGGASPNNQLDALYKGVDILVATPGRLNDFLERSDLKLNQIKYLVLDEADRMLDMGFLPQIEQILKVAPKERQTAMFSATFPTEIRRLASNLLVKDHIFLSIGRIGASAELVSQKFFQVNSHIDKFPLLQDLLTQTPGATLIFVDRKHTSSILSDQLNAANISADSIHGDKSQYQRNRALYQFNNRQIRCLVATNVAARGLDLPFIEHVVNYDFPPDIDDYVHRIGRTGRAGRQGVASSFLTGQERPAILKELIKSLNDAKHTVPEFIPSLLSQSEKFNLSPRRGFQRSFSQNNNFRSSRPRQRFAY